MVRNLIYLFTAISLVVGATGCQIEPFNGQTYSSRSTPIKFTGCTMNPGDPLEMYACKDGNCPSPGGSHLTTVLTATTVSYTDNAGFNWYCASTSVRIPSTLWRQVGSSWQTHVQMFSLFTDPWAAGGSTLNSFDNPASECPAAAGWDALTSTHPKCVAGSHPANGWNAIYAGP